MYFEKIEGVDAKIEYLRKCLNEARQLAKKEKEDELRSIEREKQFEFEKEKLEMKLEYEKKSEEFKKVETRGIEWFTGKAAQIINYQV